MKTFSTSEHGPLDAWHRPRFQHPTKPAIGANGKQFLKESLGLTGMEVSLNSMAAGEGMPFLHRHHANEELYVFISGRGEFQVDGERFEVRAGSTVRVAPQGARAWRNNGTEPLVYLVIQAVHGSMPGSITSDGRAVDEKLSWA